MYKTEDLCSCAYKTCECCSDYQRALLSCSLIRNVCYTHARFIYYYFKNRNYDYFFKNFLNNTFFEMNKVNGHYIWFFVTG